jgi:hypothetical protein
MGGLGRGWGAGLREGFAVKPSEESGEFFGNFFGVHRRTGKGNV